MQQNLTFGLFGHSVTISSSTLLVVSAGLLVFAALMLLVARRQRVMLRRSLVTDELMIHLSRIADALDRVAARPTDQFIAEASRQTERSAPPGASTEAHTIPYSMFGRQIEPSR